MLVKVSLPVVPVPGVPCVLSTSRNPAGCASVIV